MSIEGVVFGILFSLVLFMLIEEKSSHRHTKNMKKLDLEDFKVRSSYSDKQINLLTTRGSSLADQTTKLLLEQEDLKKQLEEAQIEAQSWKEKAFECLGDLIVMTAEAMKHSGLICDSKENKTRRSNSVRKR